MLSEDEMLTSYKHSSIVISSYPGKNRAIGFNISGICTDRACIVGNY